MQCPRCNWQNHAFYTQCFSCQAPLPVAGTQAGAAPAPFPDAKAPAPKPAQKQAHQAELVEVFPGTLPRLGATLIDGFLMLVLPIAMVLVWVLARPLFDAAPNAVYPAALALAVLGLFSPALMDAMGRGSPGKRLLGMRVTTRTGERPGVVRSMLRHFLKYTLTLGLTVAVPFLLHRVLTALFGERGLHSSMTGTFVVSSNASDTAIQKAVALERGPGWFLKAMVALGALSAFSFAIMVAAALWNQGDEPANPHRDQVRLLDKAARPVLQLVENHYRNTGSFPANAAAIGLAQTGQLPAGFKALAIEPANGVVRLTIADGAGEPLDGKHLVYMPTMKKRKGQGDIGKWQCGSDDIARENLSFGCRHAVAGAAK
ncbi:RDD family protein [Acidovorax sp. A1169]|uniref:RDD family protein n=1 Tax=Acidovorax sp. A1169 TaxID=3059524 RepID=UPI002737A979|nr:RDD family protein [Acidovorax sp. A1169]MDP4076928.1 RDD family protein [Acidovorax sp. A1169]